MKFFTISLITLIIPLSVAIGKIPGLNDNPFSNQWMKRDVKCTDFSGNWKGTCTMTGGSPSEVEWKVQQAQCALLTIDGREYLLNGMVTKVYSSRQDESGVSNTAFNWNKEYTELSFTQTNSGTIDVPSSFQGEIKISGNKMFYSIRSMVQKWESKCEVSR